MATKVVFKAGAFRLFQLWRGRDPDPVAPPPSLHATECGLANEYKQLCVTLTSFSCKSSIGTVNEEKGRKNSNIATLLFKDTNKNTQNCYVIAYLKDLL